MTAEPRPRSDSHQLRANVWGPTTGAARRASKHIYWQAAKRPVLFTAVIQLQSGGKGCVRSSRLAKELTAVAMYCSCDAHYNTPGDPHVSSKLGLVAFRFFLHSSWNPSHWFVCMSVIKAEIISCNHLQVPVCIRGRNSTVPKYADSLCQVQKILTDVQKDGKTHFSLFVSS